MKIILEKSNTAIGKTGRLFNPYPYTHIALTFDGENHYSFSRRKYHNPFDSGFTNEKLNYYAFEDVELKEYEVELNAEDKIRIEAFMEEIRDYPFDLYGMIKTSLGIRREKTNAYNCMTFMARILELSGIELVKQPYYKNNIADLENSLIKHGLKGQVRLVKKMQADPEYMAKVSFREVLLSCIRLHRKLYGKQALR